MDEAIISPEFVWKKMLAFYGTSRYMILYLAKLYMEAEVTYESPQQVYNVVEKKYEYVEDSERDECMLSLGLMCASASNSHLKIAQVPESLEWSIEEYDGLERIVVI